MNLTKYRDVTETKQGTKIPSGTKLTTKSELPIRSDTTAIESCLGNLELLLRQPRVFAYLSHQ